MASDWPHFCVEKMKFTPQDQPSDQVQINFKHTKVTGNLN